MNADWLRSAIAENRTPIVQKFWRAVEAQHLVSTLRLTRHDPADQELLELILEEYKPPIPAEALKLHYLLATPFRYPPSPRGSRFRAWPDPGVLHGALSRRTACAEMGYWRWRFVQESEGLRQIEAAAQTLFQASASGDAVDLRQPPLEQEQAAWTAPQDYSATQGFGRLAREAGLDLLLYRSVRDPEPGVCVAVLQPSALKPKRPLAQETWYLTVTAEAALWTRQGQRFQFLFAERRGGADA